MFFDLQGAQMSLEQVRSISSLEPYRLYHFRARSKFRSGLWSQWSTDVSSWTQEEGKQSGSINLQLYCRAYLCLFLHFLNESTSASVYRQTYVNGVFTVS